MKKIIAAVLCLIFVLSVFCACGDEPKVISCYASPYNSQYFLGGYDIYAKGVESENADKIDRNSEHFPVHRIDSVAELKDFRTNTLLKYVPRGTTPELTEQLKSYTDEFFVNKTLLLVGTDSDSDSHVFYISSVKNDGKNFTLGLSYKLIAPGVEVYSTGSYGILTVEIERKELEGIKSFDAVDETAHEYYDAKGGLLQPTFALDIRSMDGCLVYYDGTERVEHYGVVDKTDSAVTLYTDGNESKIVFDVNKNGVLEFNAAKTSKNLEIGINNRTEFEAWHGAPRSTSKFSAEGIIDAEYKISRFRGYSTYRYLTDSEVIPCENMKQILPERSAHLPIHVIDSKAYLDEYIRVMLHDDPRIANDSGEAAKYLGGFDESYFDEKAFLVIPLESGSGSYRYYVADIKNQDGCLTVEVSSALLIPDAAVTSDMAYWLFVIEVDKALLEDADSFDAVYATSHLTYETDIPYFGYYGPKFTIDTNSKEYFFNFCVPYKNPQRSKYISRVQNAQSVTLYGKFEESESGIVLLQNDEHGNRIVLDLVDESYVYNAQKSDPVYELYLEDGTVFKR